MLSNWRNSPIYKVFELSDVESSDELQVIIYETHANKHLV